MSAKKNMNVAAAKNARILFIFRKRNKRN